MLSDWERFSEETIEENIDKVYGQPFSSSLGMQASAAGFGLELDYRKLEQILDAEPKSRGVEVLRYQLNICRKMIPERC